MKELNQNNKRKKPTRTQTLSNEDKLKSYIHRVHCAWFFYSHSLSLHIFFVHSLLYYCSSFEISRRDGINYYASFRAFNTEFSMCAVNARRFCCMLLHCEHSRVCCAAILIGYVRFYLRNFLFLSVFSHIIPNWMLAAFHMHVRSHFFFGFEQMLCGLT